MEDCHCERSEAIHQETYLIRPKCWANSNMVFLNIQENLISENYWKSFAPDFHIADSSFWNFQEAFSVPEETKAEMNDYMLNEGFYKIDKSIVNYDPSKHATLVKKLVSANLLPVFAMIYDEFWLLQASARNAMEAVLGTGYTIRPCMWVWHVDPKKEESGWYQHRDGDINSLHEDKRPKVLSLWIPLTQATPQNGCMYVKPMNREEVCVVTNKKADIACLQDMQALPAEAGDMYIWNFWVLHWGSKATKRAKEPRISVAFEIEEAGSNLLEAPLMDPFRMPSYEERLRIIAYQIKQYMHMYKFNSTFLEFADNALNTKIIV